MHKSNETQHSGHVSRYIIRRSERTVIKKVDRYRRWNRSALYHCCCCRSLLPIPSLVGEQEQRSTRVFFFWLMLFLKIFRCGEFPGGTGSILGAAAQICRIKNSASADNNAFGRPSSSSPRWMGFHPFASNGFPEIWYNYVEKLGDLHRIEVKGYKVASGACKQSGILGTNWLVVL